MAVPAFFKRLTTEFQQLTGKGPTVPSAAAQDLSSVNSTVNQNNIMKKKKSMQGERQFGDQFPGAAAYDLFSGQGSAF